MMNPRGPVPSTRQYRSEATGMRSSSATSSMVSSASMRTGAYRIKELTTPRKRKPQSIDPFPRSPQRDIDRGLGL